MNKQLGYAAVNGTRLYYEVAGDGHPLVLIHGFGLDRRMWEAQFDVLAQSYQVIRYDLRGFGQSALPAETSYAHHEDLKALLDHLGIAHTYLLGLSLGSAIALEFALAFPEVTRALVLVDSVLWGFKWSAEQSALDGAVWTVGRQSGAEAAKEMWLNHPLFEPARKNPAVASRLRQIISEYSGWSFVSNDPGRVPDPPAAMRLSQISAPTLVLVGDHDLPDFIQIAGALEQKIAGARKAVLAGVGHMSNMEAPDAFNRVVGDFLERVAAPGSHG